MKRKALPRPNRVSLRVFHQSPHGTMCYLENVLLRLLFHALICSWASEAHPGPGLSHVPRPERWSRSGTSPHYLRLCYQVRAA